MATPSDEQDELRRRVLGLEASGRKSHYASLRQRVVELERFRSVIDLAGDLLFIVDVASGRLLDANATACDRLAVPRDDITSVDLARILSEAPRAELSRLLADFQAGLRESTTLVTATSAPRVTRESTTTRAGSARQGRTARTRR
jgi:PAS domain-containing protein